MQNTVTGLDKAIRHIKLKFLLGNMACQWVDWSTGEGGGVRGGSKERDGGWGVSEIRYDTNTYRQDGHSGSSQFYPLT